MSLPRHTIDTVLTDIEGTTTPIAFVKDTLFPYAYERLEGFLLRHARDAKIYALLRNLSLSSGIGSDDIAGLAAILRRWMDQDLKVEPLKTLQGLIWADGYRDGTLRGAIYDDAVQALRTWSAQGIRLAVYSSGSVLAQRQLFSTTRAGDLTPLFEAFFDTAVGTKRDVHSYERIAKSLGNAPNAILFLSDVAEELDAAAAAGMVTTQIVRPTDGTMASEDHPIVASMLDIALQKSAHRSSIRQG